MSDFEEARGIGDPVAISKGAVAVLEASVLKVGGGGLSLLPLKSDSKDCFCSFVCCPRRSKASLCCGEGRGSMGENIES